MSQRNGPTASNGPDKYQGTALAVPEKAAERIGL
jgi:hypothetical protein